MNNNNNTANQDRDGGGGGSSSFQRMSDDYERGSRREEFRDEYERGSSSRMQHNNNNSSEYDNKYGAQYGREDDLEEVYIVRQEYGYLSIFFSTVQGIILALMMWQCGIAPMEINPMIGPYPDALSGTQIDETFQC